MKIIENRQKFLDEIEERKIRATKKKIKFNKKKKKTRCERSIGGPAEQQDNLAEKVWKKKVKSFIDFSLQVPKFQKENGSKIRKSLVEKSSLERFKKNLEQSPKTMRNSFKPDKIKDKVSSAFKTS